MFIFHFFKFTRILPFKKYIPELVLLTAFVAIQLARIDADLWNDEIYSIVHFELVDFSTTLTDYHVPNNHIFFNLVNNVYLKAIGVASLYELLQSPWIIRVLPFVYSLVTLIFVYLLGKKIADRKAGLLAAIVLMTSIPYFYFSLQIRGYGMSMMLLTLLVYSCILFEESKQKKQLILIAVYTALLFYCVPSNLYFILGFLFFYGVKTIFSKPTSAGHFFKQYSSLVVYSLLIGISVSLLFYMNVFEEVFMNKYVKAGECFQFSKLKHNFYYFAAALLSKRIVLLLLILVGLIVVLKKKQKTNHSVLLLLSIGLIPFLAVFVRGDAAPLRIYTVAIPVFSILIGVGLYAFWDALKSKFPFNLYLLLIGLYCLITFRIEISNVQQKIYGDIVNSKRSQSLYHQYYSAHFSPYAVIGDFAENHYTGDPLVILGGEGHCVPYYLDAFDIAFYQKDAFHLVKDKFDNFYVITNHPYSLRDYQKQYKIEFLGNKLTYHNLFRLKKRLY
ncbi:MAG: glycosyltransferase family 39 protein [Crocinitomicaceae bacterium]